MATAKNNGEFGAFDVWLPVSFEKAVKGESKDDDGRIWVKGIATTPKKDLEGEDVDLSGLDWDYALETGAWFDTDHDPSPEGGRGRLTKVEPRKRYVDPSDGKQKVGAYIEGYLYPTKENRALKDLLTAMDEVGDAEGIGLSIRGPILAKTGPQGKTIAKGVVRSIAITRQPVNTDTRLSLLSKSLATAQKSLEAGAILPMSGGGSGAALLRQDITTTRSNGAMKKTAKEWFKALSPKCQEAMKAAGYKEDEDSPEDKKEDENEEGMEKSLARADEMIKSLGPLSDHLQEGGKVVLLDNDGQIVAQVEGLAEMSKSIEALGKVQTQIVNVLGEMSKALGRPALPRGVRTDGDVLAPVADLGGNSEFVSMADASRVVLGEFEKSLAAGNQKRATELAEFNAQLGSRGSLRVSKAELSKALAQ